MAEPTSTLLGLLRPGTLSRGRATLIIGVCYAFALLIVRFTLMGVEWINGYDDHRDEDMSLIFAGFVGVFFTVSLWRIFHRPKISDI